MIQESGQKRFVETSKVLTLIANCFHLAQLRLHYVFFTRTILIFFDFQFGAVSAQYYWGQIEDLNLRLF